MNRVLRLSRVFLTQSNLQVLKEMLQVDNRESWRKIKTKYKPGALMNGAHTSSKHQDYSNRRPVRPVQPLCDPLCDPHNHCATRTSGRHSLDKSERGQPFFLTSLQPTLPTFRPIKRHPLPSRRGIHHLLGLGLGLVAAGHHFHPGAWGSKGSKARNHCILHIFGFSMTLSSLIFVSLYFVIMLA